MDSQTVSILQEILNANFSTFYLLFPLVIFAGIKKVGKKKAFQLNHDTYLHAYTVNPTGLEKKSMVFLCIEIYNSPKAKTEGVCLVFVFFLFFFVLFFYFCFGGVGCLGYFGVDWGFFVGWVF